MPRKKLYKSRINVLWEFLLLPIFVVVVLSLLYSFDKIDLLKLIAGTLILVLVVLFEIKVISLYKDVLIIKYPLLNFIIKPRIFQINELEKIFFGSNNSPYDPDVIRIYIQRGKTKKYYILSSGIDQELIDKLRELGITVEVDSHIWK